MNASRKLAENDIISRGVTVKIQQVAVRGDYESPSSDWDWEKISILCRVPSLDAEYPVSIHLKKVV